MNVELISNTHTHTTWIIVKNNKKNEEWMTIMMMLISIMIVCPYVLSNKCSTIWTWASINNPKNKRRRKNKD